MRIAKTEELRGQIDIYSQNNQRELDSKEAFIQMLDKNLDEANVQYQIAIRNHLIHIDTLSEVIYSIFRSSTHAYMALWSNSREMYQSSNRNTQHNEMKCRKHIMII